jgi:hypothetical protein
MTFSPIPREAHVATKAAQCREHFLTLTRRSGFEEVCLRNDSERCVAAIAVPGDTNTARVG